MSKGTMTQRLAVPMPRELIDAIDRVAERKMTSSAAVVRQGVLSWLEKLGEWPPQSDEGHA